MKYIVNQNGLENPIRRDGKYLTIFDSEGRSYNIRVNRLGGIEISTIEGDLKVVCKTSNTLIASIDEPISKK